MDPKRARTAVKRGAVMATAFLAIGVGAWLLRPSNTPEWWYLVGAPFAIGILYLATTYVEEPASRL